MKLSIVTTLYRSETYVKEFFTRVSNVANTLVGADFEVIFVNDGSPDNSLNESLVLCSEHGNIVVIDLSRNFGHHKALMAGLERATGDYVYLIDSDLEEEPEWLKDFYKQLHEERCDVVFGQQRIRKGGWGERISGYFFYRLFRLLTGVSQPNNITTARLMTRRYVNALLLHKETEINIGGLWVITGFKQASRIVIKHATSPTTYNFSRKLSHFVNAITSFSSMPLMLIFYSGLIISGSAMMFILYLVLKYVMNSTVPMGYTSIIASIWLFSGLIIFFMGIQGVYLSKIFGEVKRRPNSIIREIYTKATMERKK